MLRLTSGASDEYKHKACMDLCLTQQCIDMHQDICHACLKITHQHIHKLFTMLGHNRSQLDIITQHVGAEQQISGLVSLSCKQKNV